MVRTVNAALASLALVAGCTLASRQTPSTGAPEVLQYLDTSSRAPSITDSVGDDPIRLWTANVGRGVVGVPALGERVTVVATVDRWIVALDTRTGAKFWRVHGNDPFATGPLVSEGRVFAATEGEKGEVNAVRLRDGHRLWRVTVGDVGAAMVARDTALYVATQSGLVYALRASTGKVLWRQAIGGSRSGPLVLGNLLIVATLGDSLFALDRTTGRVLSRAGIPTSTTAPLTPIDDSTVVLASPAGEIRAIDVHTGRARWTTATHAPADGAPVVARDTVFALSRDCVLWAIPVSEPARADSSRLGCRTVAPPLVLRDGVLVATLDGQLLYYDRRAHSRVWTRIVGGELRQPPVVFRQQMIAAPTLGPVVSYR